MIHFIYYIVHGSTVSKVNVVITSKNENYFADFRFIRNTSGHGDFTQLRKGRCQKMNINGCLNYFNINANPFC